jgi:hypothetical protein
VNNRWHLQRYEMRRELSAVRQFSQRTGRWRDPAALGGAPAAAGRARRETAHSDFFHLNDGLAFVRPAIETGIMRELQFMTLGAHRHARWGDAQLLSAALITSRAGMLMFRIGHDFFLQQPAIGTVAVLSADSSIFCRADDPDRR